MTPTTRLALIAAMLGLAACAPESSEERSPQEAAEAAEPQNTEHMGDVAATAREAVSDTQAAVNEASGEVGQAFDGSGPAAANAVEDAGQAVDQAEQELRR